MTLHQQLGWRAADLIYRLNDLRKASHMRGVALFCLMLGSAAAMLVSVHADDPKEGAHEDLVPNGAVCRIRGTKGNKTFGQIRFIQKDGFVHVTGQVRNLTEGEHGFHVHEFGDARAADGSSSGGHFNPDGHEHGGPDSDEHHAGDLGNITANADGIAKVDIKAKGLTVISVVGRAIVVHGGTDDLKSQPSGAAGPRIGVGVIGIAGPGPAKKDAKPKAKAKAKAKLKAAAVKPS